MTLTPDMDRGGGLVCYAGHLTGSRAGVDRQPVVSNGGLDGTAVNGTTEFYWNGWQTVEEHDGADAVTQQYVYGNALNELWTLDDRRVGITVAQLNDGTGNQRHFYHTDVLGSVYALTDENGKIVVVFQYDAYGRVTEFGQDASGTVTFGSNVVIVGTTVPANPHLYTAYYHDHESSLEYARERYYIVDQGRFASRDRLGYITGEVNLFIYTSNNPITRADPQGLGPIIVFPAEPEIRHWWRIYDFESYESKDWIENWCLLPWSTRSISRVDKFIDDLKKTKGCIEHLILTGHCGEDGCVDVAPNVSFCHDTMEKMEEARKKHGEKDPRYKRYAEAVDILKLIRSKLCKGGKIEFVQCQSVAGDKGKKLKQDLQKHLGDDKEIILYEGKATWFMGHSYDFPANK